MPALYQRLVAGLLAVAFVLPVSSGARAESPETPDPTYHSLRYKDDFSYLADPSKSNDWWDRFKYIHLADSALGASYVSFGGELRERFESYSHPNFGIKAPPANAYLLSRLTVDTDLHVTDYFRAFLQLGNMERLGDRGVTSTTDIDHLGIMQGFVDLNLPSPLGDAPVVRVGRAEMEFGFQRLVAVREGPNIRRDFDGAWFSDKLGNVAVDLFDVRPVNTNPSVIDDHFNPHQRLVGAYLTVPVYLALNADFYAMHFDNDTAKYRGITGNEQRQTFGMRIFGRAEGFDWNNEVAAQGGSFAGRNIRALMGAAIIGYTFEGSAVRPRIAVETNYASGDDTRGKTIGTFDAMYPRLPYFAETSLLVPSNIIDVRPVFSFKPTPELLATFGWDQLWRASKTDGLYGSGMVQYANTNKSHSDIVGTEVSADLRWRYNEHLNFGAILAVFESGPAIKQALGKSVTFTSLFATYKF